MRVLPFELNFMWIYNQGTGKLLQNAGLVGTGYAGRDAGKNNPAMQNVKGIGPLPCGFYIIGQPEDRSDTGPFSIKLHPDSGNNMFGRSSFFMHGDSIKAPGTASHGCPIFSRAVREKVNASTDKILKVEP